MRANRELYERLERDPEMCTAFKELFKDEILEAERNGERQGQEKLGALIIKLLEQGRNEDIRRASSDKEYRDRLFAEFQMS